MLGWFGLVDSSCLAAFLNQSLGRFSDMIMYIKMNRKKKLNPSVAGAVLFF